MHTRVVRYWKVGSEQFDIRSSNMERRIHAMETEFGTVEIQHHECTVTLLKDSNVTVGHFVCHLMWST